MSKRRVMIYGAMQSGKTEYVVKRALKNQEPHKIEVFIHYNTNESMESTNEKIKKYDVDLFSGLEALKRFHLRLTRKGLRIETKYVLSLIAHHSSMEQLKQIITAYSILYGKGYEFNINIDEDDTLVLDHSTKKGRTVQKQRLAQAIIELPGVVEVRNVTATPYAEHLSETDFNEMTKAPVGKDYVDVETIVENANDTFTEEDMASFFSLEPTQRVIDLIQDDFEGASLIQTSKNKKDHAIIARNIMDNCNKPHIVVIMNSDKSSYGCYVNKKGHGLKSKNWNSFKAYELAKDLGIKKVFIVAYYLSDRTNTFRARNGNFNTLRSVFHCSPSTTIETKLQRVARICGYPIGHIPQLYTTPETLDYLHEAIELHTKVMNIKEDVRLSVDRAKVWKKLGHVPLKKIKHTNGHENIHAQSYYITSEPVDDVITEKHSGIVPFRINMSSTDLSVNTELANYFRKEFNVNTVHNVTKDPKRLVKQIRPNQPSQTRMQAHRELAILFEGREYTVIKQIHEYYTTKREFALHNMDETFWQWSVNEGVTK
jgi:hypothetical protein